MLLLVLFHLLYYAHFWLAQQVLSSADNVHFSHQCQKAHASADIPHFNSFVSGARQKERSRFPTLLSLQSKQTRWASDSDRADSVFVYRALYNNGPCKKSWVRFNAVYRQILPPLINTVRPPVKSKRTTISNIAEPVSWTGVCSIKLECSNSKWKKTNKISNWLWKQQCYSTDMYSTHST